VVRGWVVVGSLLLAPVVLWATTQPLDSRFASSTATLASLANIAALTGTAAFASNVVIGSRIRPIVRLFGGLETMYAAHRRLGVYAFALLAAHAGWQPGTPPPSLPKAPAILICGPPVMNENLTKQFRAIGSRGTRSTSRTSASSDSNPLRTPLSE
jgi:predicted ferric reductase